MRKFKWLVAGLVLAISACAATLLGKETQALQSVNAAMAVANARLANGQMSKDGHKQIMLWADASKAGIVAAVKSGDGGKLDAIKADGDNAVVQLGNGVVK